MNKEKQNIQGNVNYLSDDFIINNFEEVFNNVILTTLNTIENIEIFIDSYLELNFVSDQIIKEIEHHLNFDVIEALNDNELNDAIKGIDNHLIVTNKTNLIDKLDNK